MARVPWTNHQCCGHSRGTRMWTRCTPTPTLVPHYTHDRKQLAGCKGHPGPRSEPGGSCWGQSPKYPARHRQPLCA